MTLLKVENVSKHFGGIAALTGIDVEVSDLGLLGIIGPNGAGKSTLFNVITGLFRPNSGRILFDGEDITRLRTDQISRRGVSRTFQLTLLYMEATCFENVVLGFHSQYQQPKWKSLLRTKASREEDQIIEQKTMELVEFWGLKQFINEKAKNIPYGNQRALGICIALACKPRLLLLDEPFTGMTPSETQVMMEKVRQLKERGVTVVVVEHNMKAVMSLCERIIVFSFGQKIAEGKPQEIKENPEVIEAYLGKEEWHVT